MKCLLCKLRNPQKKPGVAVVHAYLLSRNWGDRDRRVPGTCWPSTLTEWANHRSQSEILFEKMKQGGWFLRNSTKDYPLASTYMFIYLHTHACVSPHMYPPTQICIYMCIHVHKRVHINGQTN